VAEEAFFEGDGFPMGRILEVGQAAGLTPGVPVVIPEEGTGGVLYALMQGDGAPQLLRADADAAALVPVPDDAVRLAGLGDRLVWVGRRQAGTRDGTLVWAYDLGGAEVPGQPAFGRDASGVVGAVPVPGQQRILFLLADQTVVSLDVAERLGDNGVLSAYPILADLDADGRLDVLTTYGRWLVAFTQGGAIVEGFPLRLPARSVAQPLVAELSDSGAWSVVVASTDGYVYAYDLGRGGDAVGGFPLAVGTHISATPLLHDGHLYALSEAGDLRGWTLDNLGEVWWGQLYGDAQNQSYVELVADPEPGPTTTDLLVPGETYNWPNPIRDGLTHLRLTPTRACDIRITIIDAAGGLVDEIRIDAVPGGVPSEYQWQTDAPSGLYYARIEARALDGGEQTYLVKMAVVR
jgi:hypothetical protein